MISLVGYSGFVGSNIYAAAAQKIGGTYNSKNIAEAYGTKPELLIYAGMRAEKYLANTNPDADMELVYMAQENIKKIAPQKLVLISTIDVFKDPSGKNEDGDIDVKGLHAYGLNRYRLEQWVRVNYPDALIIRLPGLFGINIKKNFIYDFINVIPFMLGENKFDELCAINAALKNYYERQPNGFYRCRILTEGEKPVLKEMFKKAGFTALNFTDSRNIYQFYPLFRLWDDIQTALGEGIKLWHPATEPVSAAEAYEYLTGEEFVNEILEKPVHYDYRTKYASIFGKSGDYIMDKGEVLESIKEFVGGMDR